MTWTHGAVLIIVFGVVVLCGFSSHCSSALPGVLQLGTFIVGGVLGHMGTQRAKTHQKDGTHE